jgi:hypothetical protein
LCIDGPTSVLAKPIEPQELAAEVARMAVRATPA